MDREEEDRILKTAQAQEWARRNVHLYEPRWSRGRIFAFCTALMMACLTCYLGILEILK